MLFRVLEVRFVTDEDWCFGVSLDWLCGEYTGKKERLKRELRRLGADM